MKDKTLGNPLLNQNTPLLIYGNKNYSSWSLRAWLILHAFKVEFDQKQIKLFDPSSQVVLEQYSPTGKVPVLIHNHQAIWDSLAIAVYSDAYLIEQSIWGENSAICMSLCAEIHSGFFDLRNEMPMNIRSIRKIEPSQGCFNDIKRIENIIQCAKKRFNGEYLIGQFSAVDAFLAPIAFRLQSYALNSRVMLSDVVWNYIRDLLNHPSVLLWESLAKKEKDTVFKDEAGQHISTRAGFE